MTATVLVTGASSGVGAATVRTFHAAGWNVVATMRRPDGAPPSDRLLVQALDVTDPASVGAALDAAVGHFGGLDAVANVAGIGWLGPFETMSDDDVRRVFETNTFGPLEVMRRAVPHLRARGGGTVVNVTAGSALVPEPLTGVYSASKAALDTLTESVRYELAAQNVAVRLVEPGFLPATGFAGKVFAAMGEVPSEYREYVDRRTASFDAAVSVAFATPDDVARAVLDAATDRTHRLRRPLGGDLAERLRRRHETSEAEYDAWTWQQFGPA